MSELYQLPNGWEWKPLGEISDFEGGSQPPKKDFLYEPKDGYVRFLQIRDFSSDKNITYIPISKKNRLCDEKDILIGRYGASVGKILSGKYGAYNVAIMKTIPNFDLIHLQFFYMYLISPHFQNPLVNEISQRAAQNGFSKDDIALLEVPLPPLSEQQRIVSKLDLLFQKVDKSIELHQKNMDEVDAFMGSVLSEVFGELEGKYGLNNLLDGVYIGCKRGFNPTIIDGKVPFIGMSDIDEKSGLNTQFMMEDYKKVSNGKTKFEKNAVLVGKIFPCTQNNKTSIVPNNIDGGFATTEVYALHCLENMNPLYLNQYMRSKSINDYMVNTMVGATGRQRVPSETIKSINIPIPPLPIQQKVVKYLNSVSEKMEKVKSIQKEKMENLKALKASILDKAFRGEL